MPLSRRIPLALSLLAATATALSAPAADPQSLGWRLIAKSAATDAQRPHHRLGLTFALKLQSADELEGLLYALSTPTSPTYGQHLSLDEVNARFPPAPGAVAAVEAFIRAAAAASRSPVVIDSSVHGFVRGTCYAAQRASPLFANSVARVLVAQQCGTRSLYPPIFQSYNQCGV